MTGRWRRGAPAPGASSPSVPCSSRSFWRWAFSGRCAPVARSALEDLEHSGEQRRVALAALTEGVVTQGRTARSSPGTRRRRNPRPQRRPAAGSHVDGPALGAIHEDGSAFPGTEHPAMRALASGTATPRRDGRGNRRTREALDRDQFHADPRGGRLTAVSPVRSSTSPRSAWALERSAIQSRTGGTRRQPHGQSAPAPISRNWSIRSSTPCARRCASPPSPP